MDENRGAQESVCIRALEDGERGLGMYRVTLEEDALEHIAYVANGDARNALNAIELAVLTTNPEEGTIHITLSLIHI